MVDPIFKDNSKLWEQTKSSKKKTDKQIDIDPIFIDHIPLLFTHFKEDYLRIVHEKLKKIKRKK